MSATATMPSSPALARPLATRPYLSFEGRCEEALNFYRDVMGAEVVMLMRFKDAPKQDGCEMPPGMTPPPADKVMHAMFKVGETELFASDGCCQAGAHTEFKGIALSLAMPDAASAHALFDKLVAVGGTAQMPMMKTFFSPAFGMAMDKFGVGWMIVANPEA